MLTVLALVEMVSVPVRGPAMVGLNVTVTVQLPPTATDPPQVLPAVKSLESGTFIAATEKGWVPVFVSVSDCGADAIPRTWFPNESDCGDGVTGGPGAAVPVPDSATVCGVPDASSVIVSDAARAPVAVGLKVTVAVQLAPAARLPGQVFVCAKSPAFAPVSAMLLIVKANAPVFVSVTACPALVVCVVCEANVSVAGLRPAWGPGRPAAPAPTGPICASATLTSSKRTVP